MIRRVFAAWLILCSTAFGQVGQIPSYIQPVVSGATYSGPGDIVSGASVWYGLRAYSAAYATSLGNVADIVDTATGVSTCTIKAKANGDADLTSSLCAGATLSVTTFCTVTHAAGCSITKLYDQTGNGVHITQATLANMPFLTLSIVGSKPGITFSGAQQLVNSSSPTIAQPWTISGSSKVTGTGSYFGAVAGSPNTNWGSSFATTHIDLQAGVDLDLALLTANTFQVVQGVANSTSSSIKVDAAVPSTGNSGTNSLANIFRFGNDSFGNFMNGAILDIGIWPSGISTGNQSAINTQEHAYWGF